MCSFEAFSFHEPRNQIDHSPRGVLGKIPTTIIEHSLRTHSPQAVARRFNHLQREATVRGTQSLIDTRSARGRNNGTAVLRRRSRPQSSGGRMASPHKHDNSGATAGASSRSSPAVLAPPFLAGATLRLEDGGGFTASRRPPLSAKGLPSGTQVNAGLATRPEAPRSLAASPVPPKTSTGTKVARGGVEQAAKSNWGGGPVELSTEVKEDFAARVARRDDILQVCISKPVPRFPGSTSTKPRCSARSSLKTNPATCGGSVR